MNSRYQLLEIESHSQSISFEKNQLKNCEYQNRFSKVLRYEENNRSVIINGEQETDLREMINHASSLVPHGQSIDYELKLNLEPRSYSTATNSYLENLDLNSMIHMGQSCVEMVTEKHSSLACDVKVLKSTQNLGLMTSSGSKFEFPIHSFSISSLVTGCEEDNILFFASNLNEPINNLEKVNKFSDELLWHLDMTQNLIEIESGNYPVIFHPQLVQQSLFEVIHTAFNPVHLENGSSPLMSRIGDKIFDTAIQLRQSGKHFPMDYNGYPSETCSVVQDGILQYIPVAPQISKILNKNTTSSNFNGSWFADLTLEPGSKTFNQLLKEMDRGIYLMTSGDLIMGNILQGDLNGTIQSGFWVENGVIQGRIKNRSLGFNFYDCMSNKLIGLSKESHRFGCSHYTESPYVLIDDIRIS